MAGLLSIDVECQDCQLVTDMIVDKDLRNESQECPDCGGQAQRVFATINVSTEKLSKAIPDVVAKGRFDTLKRESQFRQMEEKAKTHWRHNTNGENRKEWKRIQKERAKARLKS